MPRKPAKALLCSVLLVAIAGGAWARSSDRNQDMSIDAGKQSGSFQGDGKTVLTGGVSVSQGTLQISSSAADIYMDNGEITRAIFTGKQVKMKQQMDDGTWMDASADRVEYDMKSEIITFIGNYTVTSARGSNRGQKMVYDTKSGNIESGGDGSRVTTVIKAKTAAPAQPPSQGKK